MRILFDHNVPRGLRGLLKGQEITTTNEHGWSELSNGQLLAQAEAADFQVMVTCDQSLTRQQNLIGSKLAIAVLPTNLFTAIRENADVIAVELAKLTPGSVATVHFRPWRRV